MSTQDALPRWLRTVFIAINDAPFTNIKSMNSEILTYATAIFLAVGLARGLIPNDKDWLVYAWFAFLSGKIGFAMGGAALKRATYIPSPPNTPDAEDVAATTATPPPPAKVLTKEDADRVAKAMNSGERGAE